MFWLLYVISKKISIHLVVILHDYHGFVGRPILNYKYSYRDLVNRPVHLVGKSLSGEAVLGFILVGGVVGGAPLHHIRLANELVRRGYRVHAWWVFDRPNQSPLDPRITQHWLFSWSRYVGLGESLGRMGFHVAPQSFRSWYAQTCPGFMDRQVRSVLKIACRGVENDSLLIFRFARELFRTGVTHLLPTVEILALFARAARDRVPSRPRYLVTFQGYELYATYARKMGLEQTLYERLTEVVYHSDWPAIAVSDAYITRIHHEIGIPAEKLTVIPPGVPVGEPMELAMARELVAQQFPLYRPDVPMVTFLGRCDSEKGIDLLLYASRLLQQRGVPLQLAICGPTGFGRTYVKACDQIAAHLRLEVLSCGYVSDVLRSALFRASRAVVYPSIHEEPFGMVPVEAMAQGTPVVVPDQGGIASVVEAGGAEGGMRFGCWDSGALAICLEELLCNEASYARLSHGARVVAGNYSIERMGERVLAHLELPAFSPQLAGLP